MPSLADADPIALVVRYLDSRSRVIEALGGEGRIGMLNEPPYPRVVLGNPPGDDRDMQHLVAPLVQFEVLADPEDTGAGQALRRILWTILEELRALPERQALQEFNHLADEPWVTGVTSTGGSGYVPLPTGQRRYIATVRLHMHP